MTLERLNSLYELIGRMNSVYELTDLLEFVIDRALSITSGRRGLLLLDDDHEHTLRHIAVARGEDLNNEHLEQALEFVSTTVIKDVLAQGEPQLVYDLPVDHRYEGRASQETFQFKRVRSVLAAPLKIETQLVGMIYIDHPSRAVFDQGDLDFLKAFSAQAALAINRARQHQQQIVELTRLNELSRAVVQVLDLDEVLTRIVYEAIHMLRVETGSVLLLNEETMALTFNVSVSEGRRVDIPTSLKVGQGIAGWVVATDQVACVNDVTKDERWFGEVDERFHTRSIVSVPLKINGRILGVIQALNKKSEQGFESGDIALLSAFAASATIAIENARLFAEASEARRLRALNEVALRLGRSLDLETILEAGLKESFALLRADAGIICLTGHDAGAGKLPVQVSRDLTRQGALAESQVEALSNLACLALAAESEEALIIDRSLRHLYPDSVALFEGGFQTLALVPIRAGQEVKGALGVMSLNLQAYSGDEISLLTGISRILALALQNAAHYSEMSIKTMHLTYLNEIGAALAGSLQVPQVLEVFIAGVNALLETERTSVFLIDEKTNELVLLYGNPDATEIRLKSPWQGIAGWVARNEAPALVNDTFSDPRYLRQIAIETGYEAHSILCVPLKIGEKTIGVVEALNKFGDKQFTNQHQELLVELSHWAAIAIQNARLVEARLQEQELRIEAENRGAMADLILNMAHTMNNIVGAIRAWASPPEYAAQTKPEAQLVQYQARLERIQQNAQEAIQLIGNIRTPFETLNADLGPTDIKACLQGAIAACWRPENITIHQAYKPALPPVRASVKGLQEAVLYNLISNAVQALMPNGGQIHCTARHSQDNWVEVTIVDDGPGIPDELRDHIFRLGTSGKSDRLGMGLWLVETFVRRFGGQIQCTSDPATGTCFQVMLPVAGKSDALGADVPQENML